MDNVIGQADSVTIIALADHYGVLGPHLDSTLKVYVVIAIISLIAYFIGNISPSTILARRAGLDIKKEGSGNAGTTNALRVMGKKAGAITCVIDILKGVVAVLIGMFLFGTLGVTLSAFFVYLGHVWPIIYKFKGGKGVATAFGATVTAAPIVALIALGVVATVVFTSKRMSVGSLVGAVALPVLSLFFKPDYFPVALIIGIILIVKHRANIQRLVKGEEPKMSIFK